MKRSALLSISAALICYSTTLDVTAAARGPWTASRVQGTPYTQTPYQIRPLFPNLHFQRPTSIEEIPGANRLIVTEIGGKIHSVAKTPGTQEADLVIDLASINGGRGTAFDTEFHPQFLKNRFVFVCYVHPDGGGHTRVSRFVLTDAVPPKIVPDTERVIITWPTGGHNGGCLEFGKEGYLYISTGDGSGPNPPDGRTTGQDVSDLLGSILRIDVDRSQDERAYGIPPDNPFIKLENARPEIWAYGLRNPWKFGVDLERGDVYVADNGWETWELVHRISRGSNGGWPVMEGPDLLRSEVTLGPTPIIPPFKAHPHTEANSVIGGPVYRGDRYPDLKGWFIYGDYITGTIWAVTPKEDGTASFQTLTDTDLRLSSLTEGSQGEVYLVDYDSTQQIYELIPTETKAAPKFPFPTRLSETGLFRSTADLEPMPGVVPYQVRAPRWMDGAQAQRWIAIPGTEMAKLGTSKSPSQFPEGTVLAKHLELPQTENRNSLRLETQLLHYEDKRWRPYTYVWNASGTEASLAEATGMDRPLDLPAAESAFLSQTWHLSAQNECRLCHNADAGYVLGFTANQMQDQLTTLSGKRVLSTVPTVAQHESLVNPNDPTQSLDDRARSYLHANCAMCHRPGGSAIASFYLRRDMSFDELQTNKGTGIGTFGMDKAKVIAAGDPYRSVLMYRMSKLGYSRMPYIGTQAVDSDGVSLISEWIQSLAIEGQDRDLISSPLLNDSAEAIALAHLSQEGTADTKKQEQAIRTLTATTEGSLALVDRLHGHRLSADTATAAIAIGNAATDPNIRGLFETFVPVSARKNRLGSNIDPDQILSLTGDVIKGETIFFGDGALCKSCHHPTDQSLSLGSTLVKMNRKYPQPSELLRHILEPSLRIDEAYLNYAFEMTDGTTINGFISLQTDEAYVIKTAELEEHTIAKKEIRTLRASQQSPMPTDLLSDLAPQDAADLLAFLQSFGGAGN
jgi:putative heme-binding domain-containing protein